MGGSRRIEGIDVARGVASLIMIQGHAYDGWVLDDVKLGAAYRFTRLLGSLPLPAFLVLAGASVALRLDAARRKGEDIGRVRRGVIRRGALVLGYGYLASFAYALMDGVESLDTVLRADVLHVIGLSIVALAWLGIRARAGALTWAAGALVVAPTLLCPWLSPLGARVQGPARFVVALFVDVPSVTLMPFVPLVAWVALGALAGQAMLKNRAGRSSLRAGAEIEFLGALSVIALGLATAAHVGTEALTKALGGTLTRAHPAVWLNVLDLGARGVLVLALGAIASQRLSPAASRMLTRLGRGSLVAYVFHIPFCYGRLGEPLRGRLDMPAATVAVIALMALSVAAVHARDRWRGRAGSPDPRSRDPSP